MFLGVETQVFMRVVFNEHHGEFGIPPSRSKRITETTRNILEYRIIVPKIMG